MENIEVIQEDQTLDCSGMLCRMPIVKTSKALKDWKRGRY
jgi:TusA-related sulfurtransferase